MTSATQFYDVIQIILQMCLCDQSLVTAAILWEKLSQPQFYKNFTKKSAFFEGWCWFKFNNLGLHYVQTWNFTPVWKRVKTKSQKVFGASSYRGKTGRVGGGVELFGPPFLNRVKLQPKLSEFVMQIQTYYTNRLLQNLTWTLVRPR